MKITCPLAAIILPLWAALAGFKIPDGAMDHAPGAWTGENNARLIRDTTVFKNGPASICLESPGVNAKDVKAVLRANVQGGESFLLTGFYRSAGKEFKGGALGVITFTRQWTPIGSWQNVANILKNQTAWKPFRKDIHIPPEAGRLMVILVFHGGGKVWLDELATKAFSADAVLLPQEKMDRYSGPTPLVRNIGAVAPNALCIELREFKRLWGRLAPYQKQEGDEIRATRTRQDGTVMERVLFRRGKRIGPVVGPNGNLYLQDEQDRVTGRPLNRAKALQPGTWTLTDSNGRAVHPAKMALKQKPVGGPGKQMRDNWYVLFFSEPLRPGTRYALDFGQYEMQTPFVFDPTRMRSEAVHIAHTGYRPDDPVKFGFLSFWTGTGGSVDYKDGTPFALLDTASHKKVFHGATTLWVPKNKPSYGTHAKGRNYAQADVFLCDFSAFQTPGEYVLYVEGVGCSYPFRVTSGAWTTAVKCSLRGFFHQRAGQVWKKPWADWDKPRAFHPDDGVVFWELSKSLLDIALQTGKRHEDLMKTGKFDQWRTGKRVPNAWGGYYDAGDYDRHTGHLVCSRNMLELVELFPEVWSKLELPIPEADNDLPDLLDEALWAIDLYKRTQRPDGAIYGGIDTNGHPKPGEPDFLNTLTCYVFAPDPRSSWRYAASAARAAYVFRLLGKPKRSDEYLQSARRAMEWAEKEYLARKNYFEKAPAWWEIKDDRNLAAVCLYRMADADRWKAVFEATCIFRTAPAICKWQTGNQTEAAFLYARLPQDRTSPRIRTHAVAGIEALAEREIKYSDGIPFMWTAPYGDPGFPLILSVDAAPHGQALCRAYTLTGTKKYLEYALRTALFSVGANPQNMAFTTGLGHRSPEFPLQCTRWAMHTPTPYSGFTVYGLDRFNPTPVWVRQWFVTQYSSAPNMDTWPVAESYWDVESWPMVDENTVQQSMAPAVYVWGYLAARDR